MPKNVIERAIECPDESQAAAMIQQALGITTGDVAAYSLPKDEYWARYDREQRAAALAEWLGNECRFAA